MNVMTGWLVNPSEDCTRLAADLQAREQSYKFRAYYDQLTARQQLRQQMATRQIGATTNRTSPPPICGLTADN